MFYVRVFSFFVLAFAGAAPFAAADELPLGIVAVSSTYEDQVTGEHVKVQGRGFVYKYDDNSFVVTASHVSQGKVGSPSFVIQENGRLRNLTVIARYADTAKDIEIFQISAESPSVPLIDSVFYRSDFPGIKFRNTSFYVHSSYQATYQDVLGTAFVIPGRNNGGYWYADQNYESDSGIYQSTRTSLRNYTAGLSGAPLLSVWDGGSPFLEGLVLARSPFFSKGWHIERNDLQEFLEVAWNSTGIIGKQAPRRKGRGRVEWEVHGGELVRVIGSVPHDAEGEVIAMITRVYEPRLDVAFLTEATPDQKPNHVHRPSANVVAKDSSGTRADSGDGVLARNFHNAPLVWVWGEPLYGFEVKCPDLNLIHLVDLRSVSDAIMIGSNLEAFYKLAPLIPIKSTDHLMRVIGRRLDKERSDVKISELVDGKLNPVGDANLVSDYNDNLNVLKLGLQSHNYQGANFQVEITSKNVNAVVRFENSQRGEIGFLDLQDLVSTESLFADHTSGVRNANTCRPDSLRYWESFTLRIDDRQYVVHSTIERQ